MGVVKELNIKNRTRYYFDYIIDIRKFESNLLKIDKLSHRDFEIIMRLKKSVITIVIVIVIVIMKIFVA